MTGFYTWSHASRKVCISEMQKCKKLFCYLLGNERFFSESRVNRKLKQKNLTPDVPTFASEGFVRLTRFLQFLTLSVLFVQEF